MILRAATAADAPAVAALWNPWITDSAITFNSIAKSPSDVAALIGARQSAGRCFLLAEAGSDAGADDASPRLLGFASYDQFRGGIGYAHSMEHTVILSPAARGRGIGQALMAAVEDHARAAGHRLMIAAVTAENLPGRQFHERLGYALWGQIPFAGYKFGRHIDLWLLGKLL